MTNQIDVVLAIDPGRSKCGVAVLRRGSRGAHEVLHQEVVETKSIAARLTDLAQRHSPEAVLVGDGTASKPIAELVEGLGIAPVRLVDEKFTTLLARKRYFQAHPPRGWRRLIPLSLQTPDRPYDDFVAVILAERFFDG